MSMKTRISSLIFLIFSAVGCAILFSVIVVNYYGPTGNYSTNQTLLEPDLIPVLSFNDSNNKTGAQSRFVFGEMTFSYFDVVDQSQKTVAVTIDQYREFYQTVQSEKSIVDVPSDIEGLFMQGNPSRLELSVRTESDAAWQKDVKIFQRIEFANEGNFFRVQLREERDPSTSEWAYYYHPTIKQQVFNQFVKP